MIFRKVLCLAAILFLLVVPCVYAQSLLQRSLSTASDDELRAMASAFGLDPQGTSSELLGRILVYFNMDEEVEAPADSLGFLRSDDGSSTTVSIEHSNCMFTIGDLVVLDGDVSLAFADSTGSKRTLIADKVVVDIGLGSVEASGDVVLEDGGGESKRFSGNAVYFNWESMDVVVFNGTSSTERKNASGNDVSLFVSGKTISYDGEKSIAFFGDGSISTVQNDPYWSIDASKVSFSGSDVFIDGALVKLGRVPIFYFPFFFYPGTTLAFNPAIGLSSDRGRFINTTTELYGVYPKIGQTSSSSSSSDSSSNTDLSASILSLLDSGDSSEKVRDGFVYRTVEDGEDLGSLETWARKSKSYFAFFADAYENIGLVAGYDTSNSFLDGALTVDSMAALAYNASESSFDSRTRYYVDLNFKFKGRDASISLTMPYYSDYLAKHDLLNRNTKFGMDAVFGTNQEFPDTYSSQRQYSWTLDANASLRLGQVSLRLGSLKAQIDFELESKYSDGRYSYEPKIRSATLPDLSFSSNASWTIAQFKAAGVTSSVGGDDLDYENALARSFEDRRQSLLGVQDVEADDSMVSSLDAAGLETDVLDAASAEEDDVPVEDAAADEDENRAMPSSYAAPNLAAVSKNASASNGSIDVGYTFNQVFKNKYAKELEPSGIYSKTYGTIYAKGSSVDSWIVFSETLKPQYSFSNDIQETAGDGVSYKNVHDMSLVSNLELQSKPIGLTYKLSNKVYSLSAKESNGVVSQDVSKWGEWNSTDVTEHSIELSHRLGSFALGLKGTIKPVKESLKPSASFSMDGFTASIDMSFEEKNNGFGPGLGNLGLGYSCSWLSLSLKNAYDFEKFNGVDFVSGYSLSQSASLKFLSGKLSFSEDLSYKAGLEPSSMKFSASGSSGFDSFVFNGSCSISFKGEEGKWNLDVLKVKFDNRLNSVYFWKNRIGFEMSVSADFTYSFANPYSTSLSFVFNAQFAIAEFLSLNVGVKSSNRSFYRYFDNGSFSFGSMLDDLLRSFDFFGEGRHSTGFNLSSIDVELVHYMRDWDLCLSVEGGLKAQRNGRYAWSPVYKIYVKWNAIPELKVERTIDRSKEV